MTMGCDDTERWLTRLVDDAGPEPGSAIDRLALERHLAGCATCRLALQEQRLVAGVLRARPQMAVSAAFAARLGSRLDEASGWIGILDWRAWTFRLAPVALALAVAAFFTGGSGSYDASTATLDAWTRGVEEPTSAASAASAVWQDGTSPEALLETILTGSSGPGEDADVR